MRKFTESQLKSLKKELARVIPENRAFICAKHLEGHITLKEVHFVRPKLPELIVKLTAQCGFPCRIEYAQVAAENL